MKKFITVCAFSLLAMPVLAQDNETGAPGNESGFDGNAPAITSGADGGFGGGDLPPGDIAPLEDVISGMSETEFSAFEQNIEQEGGFSEDVGFALDQASISQALEAGVITQEQADTVGQLVELVEANSESFDFDLEQMITEELTNGNIGGDEALRVLQTFNSLSDADKQIAGQADFDPARDYDQLSAAGQESLENYFRQEIQIQAEQNPEEFAGLLQAAGVSDVSELTIEQISRLEGLEQEMTQGLPEGVDPTGAGSAAGGPDPTGAGSAAGGPDPTVAGGADGGPDPSGAGGATGGPDPTGAGSAAGGQ